MPVSTCTEAISHPPADHFSGFEDETRVSVPLPNNLNVYGSHFGYDFLSLFPVHREFLHPISHRSRRSFNLIINKYKIVKILAMQLNSVHIHGRQCPAGASNLQQAYFSRSEINIFPVSLISLWLSSPI